MAISKAILKNKNNLFITRLKKKQANLLIKKYPSGKFNKQARTFFVHAQFPRRGHSAPGQRYRRHLGIRFRRLDRGSY